MPSFKKTIWKVIGQNKPNAPKAAEFQGVDTGTRSPHTGLPIIIAPQAHAQTFSHLTAGDVPMYLFEGICKVNADGRSQVRVLCIFQDRLVIATTEGEMKRTVILTDVKRLVVDQRTCYLGIVITSSYDILFKVPAEARLPLFINVLETLCQICHPRGHDLNVIQVDTQQSEAAQAASGDDYAVIAENLMQNKQGFHSEESRHLDDLWFASEEERLAREARTRETEERLADEAREAEKARAIEERLAEEAAVRAAREQQGSASVLPSCLEEHGEVATRSAALLLDTEEHALRSRIEAEEDRLRDAIRHELEGRVRESGYALERDQKMDEERLDRRMLREEQDRHDQIRRVKALATGLCRADVEDVSSSVDHLHQRLVGAKDSLGAGFPPSAAALLTVIRELSDSEGGYVEALLQPGHSERLISTVTTVLKDPDVAPSVRDAAIETLISCGRLGQVVQAASQSGTPGDTGSNGASSTAVLTQPPSGMVVVPRALVDDAGAALRGIVAGASSAAADEASASSIFDASAGQSSWVVGPNGLSISRDLLPSTPGFSPAGDPEPYPRPPVYSDPPEGAGVVLRVIDRYGVLSRDGTGSCTSYRMSSPGAHAPTHQADSHELLLRLLGINIFRLGYFVTQLPRHGGASIEYAVTTAAPADLAVVQQAIVSSIMVPWNDAGVRVFEQFFRPSNVVFMFFVDSSTLQDLNGVFVSLYDSSRTPARTADSVTYSNQPSLSPRREDAAFSPSVNVLTNSPARNTSRSYQAFSQSPYHVSSPPDSHIVSGTAAESPTLGLRGPGGRLPVHASPVVTPPLPDQLSQLAMGNGGVDGFSKENGHHSVAFLMDQPTTPAPEANELKRNREHGSIIAAQEIINGID